MFLGEATLFATAAGWWQANFWARTDDFTGDEAELFYAAYDPVLDRKVALKLLKLHYSSDHTASMRLQREAQALARPEHPPFE